MSKSIGKNIFFNVGGYAVSVLVAFLIAPITIHTLGDTRYGAWVLVSELIGYYGLLDLGIRGAVTYHVARYSSRNQQTEIQETLASAFWILSASGLLVLLAGIGLTLGFPYFFRTDGLNIAEVQKALLIMSGLIAFSLPMNAFGGALIGKERFDISSGVEVANRVLTALMVYLALKMGGGLVALALVQTVCRIISFSVTLIACRKVLGGLFIRPKWFSFERVRDLAGYGFRNAIGQLAMLIIYRLDLTVVGIFAGVSRVTHYSIAGTLVTYASSLCTSITFSYTPRFTHLVSTQQHDALSKLFFWGMKTTGMVVTGLLAGIFVFGKDFIRLWLGEAYVVGPWTDRSDVIMSILVVANLPILLQSISRQRLYAMARMRFLMWLSVGEAVANLLLSLLLVQWYGPAGVALGTFFPLMVSHLFIMPIYCSRAFDVPLWIYFRKGLAIPLITGLLMACINLIFIRIAPPHTWWIFCCDTLIAATLGILICVAVGLNRQERQSFLLGIQKRFSVQSI